MMEKRRVFIAHVTRKGHHHREGRKRFRKFDAEERGGEHPALKTRASQDRRRARRSHSRGTEESKKKIE